MGKQRFRLSHMIPNAWFYRLRDMNTAMGATHNKKPLPSAYSSTPNHTRNSFCYTPRLHRYNNSPTPTSNTNIINHPAVSICTQPTEFTHTHDQDLFLSPIRSSYNESPVSESILSLARPPSTSCSCGVISSSTTDVVIEFNKKSYTKKIQDSSGYELIRRIELQKPPPIITKSNKDTLTLVEKKEESSNQSSISIKIVKDSFSKKENPERKPVSGVKIRSNSSRTPVCKRIVDANNDHKRQKNNLSSSCCIVKSSFDPQKDFKESMVEMIVEEKIWASRDLEKLLASYLSLNSNEYHEMIIKAFEEIWLSFKFVD
ncbi:transcription repressor OFP1-like [Cynara cardunculus var. scolymus]|uniref:Transcription repressor n=1 Tax=Cynara cardunculus var. scolymus TaxID=59895 RepID=A0A103YLH6_CYNCS|nr:transcription repressor OFP1-like [Cynara cardunculus var. scolymus]KVI11360.1 DNA-binding domain, ovate family-like protein [Cynara cardunculus var. scolymus]